MSISEIFDHGAPHPWANLRVNNLAVDGTLTGGTSLTTLVISMSGPIPATNFTFLVSKFGRKVTINLPDVQTNGAGGVAGQFITSAAGAIPANLLPDFSNGTVQYLWMVRSIDNNVIQAFPGLIRIIPTGAIAVFLTQSGGGFTNLNSRGTFATTISYRSAI